MARSKQTARGSLAPRPRGMATARFAGTGRGRGDPENQFADEPIDIADKDLPNMLEDADKPKGGEQSTSTTTISTNPCQNGGRNRTAGRQDIQGTDHVTTLARC